MVPSPLYSTLREVFQVNGHSLPSGVPLYRYRCNDAQYERLETLLKAQSRFMNHGKRAPMYVHEAFCLYCAEWVRRNHTTGHVKWSDITEALEWPTLTNSTLTYLTEKGLKFWKRPLRTKGNKPAYLLTLVLEGGLPLKMISANDGALVSYFRKVLNAFRQSTQKSVDGYELASSYDEYLPTSLRNDVVFNLAGEFCSVLHQQASEADAYRTNIVAKIKECNSQWYKQLPVVLSEKEAEELAKAVFANDTSASSRVRTTLKVQREWVKEEETWFCETAFKLPLQVKSKVLENHFNLCPSTTVSRLILSCVFDGEAKTLALLSKNDDEMWAIEKYAAANDIISGQSALSEFTFQLYDRGTLLGSYVPVGGEALSDGLPWILEPLNEDMTRLRLLGSGSLSAKSPIVYLAIPLSNSFITLDSEGDFGIPEIIDSCNRYLTPVRGDYVVTLEDGVRCNIKTGQVEDDVPHYVFGRTAFKNITSKYPIFTGEPVVYQIRGTDYQRLDTNAMVWRRLRPGQPEWFSYAERKPLGKVEIRQIVDGVVKYSSKCIVLPKDASITLVPRSERSGLVKFYGFDAATIADLNEGEFYDTDSICLDGESHLSVVSKSLYKQPLKLKITWPDAEPAELVIPFPAKGSRFTGLGKEVSRLISIGQLFGMRAEGVQIDGDDEKYWVEAEKKASNLVNPKTNSNLLKIKFPMIAKGSEGTKELSLAAMQRPIQSLLASSSGTESISLRAFSAGTRESVIAVGRYPMLLTSLENEICLTTESIENLSEEVLAFAINLASPNAEPLQLNIEDNGFISLDNLVGKQGAWLIYCQKEGTVVSNQIIANNFVNTVEEPTLLSQSLYNKEAATAFVDKELNSFTSAAWYELLNTLASLERFDGQNFSILQELQRDNKHLLNLLFLSTFTGNYEQIWNLENQLGFTWGGIPLQDWRAAIEKLVLDTQSEHSFGVPMLAMMQLPLRTLAQRDWRIRSGTNIVLGCLASSIGQPIELASNATEIQVHNAIQELIRLVDNLARIDGFSKEMYFGALASNPALAKAVKSCWFSRQYSIEVEKLVNHVMLWAALTLLDAEKANQLSKLQPLLNLAYQQAPEHFGPIFNYFQNNLVK